MVPEDVCESRAKTKCQGLNALFFVLNHTKQAAFKKYANDNRRFRDLNHLTSTIPCKSQGIMSCQGKSTIV